jgi:hypothetical protein
MRPVQGKTFSTNRDVSGQDGQTGFRLITLSHAGDNNSQHAWGCQNIISVVD